MHVYAIPVRHPPIVRFIAQDGPKTTKGRHMAVKLADGAPAPDFRLMRDGGGTVSLADFKGRKLVLYFYPKAETPGCTVEAKDFSRLQPAFPPAGTHCDGASAVRARKRDASE